MPGSVLGTRRACADAPCDPAVGSAPSLGRRSGSRSVTTRSAHPRMSDRNVIAPMPSKASSTHTSYPCASSSIAPAAHVGVSTACIVAGALVVVFGVAAVSRQFLRAPPEPEVALTLAEFRAALAGEPAREVITRFLETERRMCEMGGTEPECDDVERFKRYREWARFSEMGRAVVQHASVALGLGPDVLYGDPRRFRF